MSRTEFTEVTEETTTQPSPFVAMAGTADYTDITDGEFYRKDAKERKGRRRIVARPGRTTSGRRCSGEG